MQKNHWAEIRCDYLDESDMFWRVDAWKTAADDEEGKVIAYVDDLTGRVLYIDPLAQVDQRVAEVIAEKQREISERKKSDPNDLWNILLAHFGHQVEIAIYGDVGNPANVSLEDIETGTVILDAELYNICAR